MTHSFDHLLIDLRLATLAGDRGYGLVDKAALGWKDGRIVFAGPASELGGPATSLAESVQSAGGRLATPALIDCHTHLVFAGSRVGEFEQRLSGASYADIAAAGGGILATVNATRMADPDTLLAHSLARARLLADSGVATIEVKSGYGLDIDTELRQLHTARRIGSVLGLDVRPTLLAAHALPPEFADDRSRYIDRVCNELIPEVAARGLAEAVDAYLEPIAFRHAEVERVFRSARDAGLAVKLHADQLSDSKGAALAAAWQALSADHLEYTDADGVAAMAAAGTVAVMLPGAFHALRESQIPPIEAFRRAGVALAVASDLNPGTSPLRSLTQAMSMACTLFRMTPEEALRGTTVQAARALGLDDRGRLLPGQRADVALWSVEHPAELCYWLDGQRADDVWSSGRRIAGSTVA